MKKVILYKKKQKTLFQLAKKIRRRAVMAAVAAGLFFTSCEIPACAEQANSSVVSKDIYHTHAGNEAKGGECYAEPVYHTHAGNETAGGSCYQTPVYHTHTGNTSLGGGCYGKAVYHSHDGNEQSGGACYEAVLHSHTDGCMSERDCTISYEIGAITETWTEYCYHHHETNHGKAEAKLIHSSCGKGTVQTTITYCIACGPYPRSHTYEVSTCGMAEGAVTGYRLACSKSTATPESYELSCGKNSATIEKYQLSCTKNGRTIESYRCSCKLPENKPVAHLILKNMTDGAGQTVTLTAEIEDLTGGSLDFSGGTYLWYDKDGSVIANGKVAEVNANGTYRAEFVPSGKKNLTGLESSITVKNVYVPTPAPTAKPTAAPTAKPTAAPTAKPTAAPTAKPTAAPTERPTAAPTAKPTAVPTTKPTAKATTAPVSNSNRPSEENGLGENITESNAGKDKEENPTPTQTPTPTPAFHPASVTEKIKSASQKIAGEAIDHKIKIQESPSPSVSPSPAAEKELSAKQLPSESDRENTYEVLGEERKGEDKETQDRDSLKKFMEKPAVKVITITMGTLVGAGFLFLLLIVLFKTVKVYNDDGTGQMIYLGRCIVMQEGEDFSISISRAMAEKACTNRYSVRAGLFMIGKSDEQELFVCKGQKKISVYLNKEMIVII